MNYIKIQDFINATINQVIDVDGYYGGQCWDLFAKFCKMTGIPTIGCAPTGYVRSIWEKRANNGVLNHFIANTGAMQPGDWAIWIGPCAVTNLSHIAMFVKDNGNGTGLFLTQNPGATRYLNITYSGIAGSFRPSIYNVVTPVQPVNNDPITLKYSVGQKMVFTGTLFGNAKGEKAGQTRQNLVCTISKTYNKAGTTKPYNIDNGLGWVAEGELTPYVEPVVTKPSFNIGDNVKIIGHYAASSESTSAGYTVAIGWTRRILNIWYENDGKTLRPYPYQVGNDQGTTGFFNESSIQKI